MILSKKLQLLARFETGLEQQTRLLAFMAILWIFASVVISLMSVNQLLTAASLLLMPVLLKLLWRPGEPPILFFAIFIQWMQVSMHIFHSNLNKISVIESVSIYALNTDKAIWYSLLGLLVLSIGIRFGSGWKKYIVPRQDNLERYSIKKFFYAYLIFFMIGLIFETIGLSIPGLRQILLVFFNLKWVFLFGLFYLVFYMQKNYLLLFVPMTIELVFGMTGFFSGYKQIFFILLLAIASARPTVRYANLLTIFLIVISLLYFSLFWTTIKIDFRKYVNAGTNQQVIVKDFGDRFNWVTEKFFYEQFDVVNAADELMKRIAYVDYFSRVIRFVPDFVPHEDGRIWKAALIHVFTPRIFFPDKPIIDDSKHTMKYTGLEYLSGRGTSVSIGYMADSYVDFSFPGMLVPVFLLGIFLGLVYRYFVSRRSPPLINHGIAISVLIVAYLFEINAIKLVGGVLTSALVMAVLLKYILPLFINRLYLKSVFRNR